MVLKKLGLLELLNLNEEIKLELKRRGIAKTRNQPVAEYAKWLVSRELGFIREKNPSEKFDGKDQNGKRYLVRSRNIPDNRAVQFGVIRNLEVKNFDYLVIVKISNDFKDIESYKIPYELIIETIEKNDYQNGYIVRLNKLNLRDSRIEKLNLNSNQ